jgi:hypothetical protein
VASTRQSAPADRVRLRTDLRGDRATTVVLGRGAQQLRVTFDPAGQRLSVRAGRGQTVRTPVPFVKGWRTLTVTADGPEVTAQVGSSDLADPAAEAATTVPGFAVSAAPVQLVGTDTLVDNLSVRPLARPRTQPAAEPQIGRLLVGDEFDGSALSGWDVVRPTDDVTVADGSLRWRLTSTDLTGGSNNATVLLRTPPTGNWVAETKLRLDLGTDTVRNYQQAGLIAYRSDDDFARLGSVA